MDVWRFPTISYMKIWGTSIQLKTATIYKWLGALGFPGCSRYFLWMFTPVSPKMGSGISHRCHRNPPWSSNIFGQLKRAIFGARELAQIGPPGWETQRFFFGTSSINLLWVMFCLFVVFCGPSIILVHHLNSLFGEEAKGLRHFCQEATIEPGLSQLQEQAMRCGLLMEESRSASWESNVGESIC